jgi:membrane protein DedA with SNARE-associated domain
VTIEPHMASISGQVVDFVGRHGVVAVFVLMAIDALLPVGGELTMLYAGAIAGGVVVSANASVFGIEPSRGIDTYLVMVAAGVLGSLAGSLIGWGIGLRGGAPLLERHGRWLHLPPHRAARAQRWFDRFGGRAVFVGRLTPLARSFISVSAGVFRARLGPYVILTVLASTIWCAAFAGVGWALSGSWGSFDRGFHYVDDSVVAIAVVVVALLVGRSRRRAAATIGADAVPDPES